MTKNGAPISPQNTVISSGETTFGGEEFQATIRQARSNKIGPGIDLVSLADLHRRATNESDYGYAKKQLVSWAVRRKENQSGSKHPAKYVCLPVTTLSETEYSLSGSSESATNWHSGRARFWPEQNLQ